MGESASLKNLFLFGFLTFVLLAPGMVRGQEKVLFSGIPASKVEVLAHVNEKVTKTPPAGNKAVITKNGLEMTYNFTTKGHDAFMAEFPVNVKKFNYFEVTFTAETKGMRPYLVLTDAGNEKHYYAFSSPSSLKRQAIKITGRQKMGSFVLLKNRHKGEYYAYRWGGDDNQILNFPVKKLMIGINDHPDTFVGKGKIIFHSITFSERKMKK